MYTRVLAFRQRLGIIVFGLLALALLSACNVPDLGSNQNASRQAPQSNTAATLQKSTVGLPARLFIQTATVHIDAPVEPVGIDASGNLATPMQQEWDGTGWYHLGPRPGETGSAVIDGHLDRPGGAPAVFWELKDLTPGAQINVVDAQGTSRHFRVDRIERYAPDAAPLQDIFNNTTGRYLNLITCAGTWIPAQHQTTERLVVYSTLVG